MIKNRKTTLIKTMMVMLLAIVVTAGVCGPNGEVYAGGTAKVTLGNVSGVPEGTEFTFNIYKVGHWTHDASGQAVLELDDAVATGSGAAKTLPDYRSENSDLEALITHAETVGNYVRTSDMEPAANPITLKTGKKGADGTSDTFNGLLDNALYLLVGDPVVVGRKVWTPKCVYMGIVDGEAEMNISNDVVTKMTSAPVVDNYSIRKVWEDNNNEKGYRPKSIKADIFYNNEKVDTVTLNDANNWSYSWKTYEDDDNNVIYENTDEKKEAVMSETLPDGDNWHKAVAEFAENGTWTVAEVNDKSLRKYTLSFEGPSEEKPGLFTLTNTYSSTDLVITKTLDGIFDTGEKSNVTVAFEVIGTVTDENGVKTEVYRNYAGIAFTKNDPVDEKGRYLKTVTLTGVPLNADIEVREVYASGYTGTKVSGPTKGDDDIWTVTFDNTHGDYSGSGVVNKYEDGKIKEQQR